MRASGAREKSKGGQIKARDGRESGWHGACEQSLRQRGHGENPEPGKKPLEQKAAQNRLGQAGLLVLQHQPQLGWALSWCLVTSGHTWSHLVIPGQICSHLLTPGQIWSHVITPGHTSHLVTPGHTMSHLVTPIHTWSNLITSGHTCSHLVTPGHTWSHLVIAHTCSHLTSGHIWLHLLTAHQIWSHLLTPGHTSHTWPGAAPTAHGQSSQGSSALQESLGKGNPPQQGELRKPSPGSPAGLSHLHLHSQGTEPAAPAMVIPGAQHGEVQVWPSPP